MNCYEPVQLTRLELLGILPHAGSIRNWLRSESPIMDDRYSKAGDSQVGVLCTTSA